ncbi:type I phosphomannose isomerase catalytic subunit [Spiroplasma turonicum]|uniref:Mannose-6-phosphate isomerase n=1 Tax=Spiroplasma turonicum TaxID=216946 RepID=A0A0K1P4V6_9MOLU|nr:type I phosphomannose isomerase catalytic subunit [Spiroplasma turonicum]AKU79331.1 mannose-6-phosphate isomerase [Spiroplasma turonicum]ALX70352.1 mannose-6-phosphate isomerase [Spiroplasma turonicum]
MADIIKIEPYFSKKIWGGQKLKDFGYNIGNDNIGEAWVLSAHPNGMSYLMLDDKKVSLLDFYNTNRTFFGNYPGEFPILAKIITANDNLSVQVHPTDEYALRKHNSLGKPESWYIIDCEENSKLIYGHSAKNIGEFKKAIEDNKWDSILNKVSIKKGDFLYVEPGKIHAITPNVTLFELQRSSDITYRLYDYDRIDNGKKRELHIEDSLNNIVIPDTMENIITDKKDFNFESEFFSINKINVQEKFTYIKPLDAKWMNFTILSGEGKINNVKLKAGDTAICDSLLEFFEIKGKIEIIFYWV